MTDEDRFLLLNDILSRLVFGVKMSSVKLNEFGHVIDVSNDLIEVTPENISVILEYYDLATLRPWLRSMYDISESELKELRSICTMHDVGGETYEFWGIEITHSSRYGKVFSKKYEAIDWLNKHHFDYRGLLERGLALMVKSDIYENSNLP